MAEDDRFGSRHVVDPVLEFFAGTAGIGGKAEDFAAQPATEGVVGDNESDSGQQGDEQRLHAFAGAATRCRRREVIYKRRIVLSTTFHGLLINEKNRCELLTMMLASSLCQ